MTPAKQKSSLACNCYAEGLILRAQLRLALRMVDADPREQYAGRVHPHGQP